MLRTTVSLPSEFVRSSTRHITRSGSDAPFTRYSPLNYNVTLKLEFGVTQGHRKWHYSIEHTAHTNLYSYSIINTRGAWQSQT